MTFHYLFGGTIPHYYGDAVRTLFVLAAVLIGISIPFTADVVTSVTFAGPVMVALLVLAGLLSPHTQFVIVLSAIMAGLGVVVAQLVALSSYVGENGALFAFYEAISILFMASLYFSVKTVRAHITHKLGRSETSDEFVNTDSVN